MVEHFGQTAVDESIRVHGFASFVKPILENLADSRVVNYVFDKLFCKLDDLGQIELSSEGNDKLDRAIKVCKEINQEFGAFNKAHVWHYLNSYGPEFTRELRDYLAHFSDDEIFNVVNKYGNDSPEYLSLKKFGYKEQLIVDAFERLGADKARAFLSCLYVSVGRETIEQSNEEALHLLDWFETSDLCKQDQVDKTFSNLRGNEDAEQYWEKAKSTLSELNIPNDKESLIYMFVTLKQYLNRYSKIAADIMRDIDHKLLADVGVFRNACLYLSKYRSVEIVQKILLHEIWEGATKEQIRYSLGDPDTIDKRPGPRVTWEGWYYGGQTEKTAKRVVWFRKSSNNGEEGAQKWNIRR